jgi:hypothetical protein
MIVRSGKSATTPTERGVAGAAAQADAPRGRQSIAPRANAATVARSAPSSKRVLLGFTDLRDRTDEREIDQVSKWLLTFALGLIVLGSIFAMLHWFNVLPPLPASANLTPNGYVISRMIPNMGLGSTMVQRENFLVVSSLAKTHVAVSPKMGPNSSLT